MQRVTLPQAYTFNPYPRTEAFTREPSGRWRPTWSACAGGPGGRPGCPARAACPGALRWACPAAAPRCRSRSRNEPAAPPAMNAALIISNGEGLRSEDWATPKELRHAFQLYLTKKGAQEASYPGLAVTRTALQTNKQAKTTTVQR